MSCPLGETGVTQGSYGGASDIPVIYVGSDGRVRSAANVSVTIPPGLIGAPLNSGQMIVGNASNLSAAVSMSGDSTMSNAGVVSLAASGPGAGAIVQAAITIDAKGRVSAMDETFFLFIYHAASTAFGTVANTIIKYDSVGVSGGTGLTYDLATGYFSCTVSGNYRVELSQRVFTTAAYIKLSTVAGTAIIVAAVGRGDANTRNSAVVTLTAGVDYALKLGTDTLAYTTQNSWLYENSCIITRVS